MGVAWQGKVGVKCRVQERSAPSAVLQLTGFAVYPLPCHPSTASHCSSRGALRISPRLCACMLTNSLLPAHHQRACFANGKLAANHFIQAVAAGGHRCQQLTTLPRPTE
jgi:hypothetical protein